MKSVLKFLASFFGFISERLFLFLTEFSGNALINLIVFLAITVSTFSIITFQIIETNFNNYIKNQFAASIPPNIIKITPKPAPKLGFLKLRRPPGSILNDAKLKRISRWKEVQSIEPVMASQIPMQALISVFGLRYRTDLVCLGVPYNMIKDELKKKSDRLAWRNWNGKKNANNIPTMLPKTLFDAYNSGMAEANGLPTISENFALGLKFQIIFGQSSVKKLSGAETRTARMVGFTRLIKTIALVVPYQVTRYYNQKFKGDKAAEEYIYSFVKVRHHKQVQKVVRLLKKMGFLVETKLSLSKEILALEKNVETLLHSLMLLILFLSIVAVTFSTLIATLDRIELYRLYRILGDSKLSITLTILIKYALIGWLGALSGSFLIRAVIHNFLPSLSVMSFHITLSPDPVFIRKVRFFGILIPALSAIPAIISLYSRGLNHD